MDTIKIGTSENYDIKFYGKDITSSVWATISASNKKMLVLKILANNVRCFVNNNNVIRSAAIYSLYRHLKFLTYLIHRVPFGYIGIGTIE